MQPVFIFTQSTDLRSIHDRLSIQFGRVPDGERLDLIDQFVHAFLGSRTYDQISSHAFERLKKHYHQPKKDWCDINELVYSVVNRLEDRLKNHQLKIEINEKLPLFKLDVGLMEQVLYNLINNAIIYTEPNTTITISATSTLEVSGHFSDHDFHTQRDKVLNSLVIDVMDNGKGFPEDEINYVFDKFYRLKNSKTGGTGLGLSIARGFVEAHNGTIDLTNLATSGAKFTINIPAETSNFNKMKNEK